MHDPVSARTVALDAPAKINLFLHVVGRRADGYHELESLFVFADVGDRLDLAPAEDLHLEVTGPFAAALAGKQSDNLIIRAASELRDASGRSGLGAAITLDKQLPIAAGIGGGSADAAAALKGLVRLWGLSIDPSELAAIALKLGADVPACLDTRPRFVTGIGEQLRPAAIDIPPYLVLVNPGIGVATADIFTRLRQSGTAFSRPLGALPTIIDLDWLAAFTRNDLEAPALAAAPVIRDVLDVLAAGRGCRLARMSGSGATCFALYDTADTAAAAEAAIRAQHPGWWVRRATLHD